MSFILTDALLYKHSYLIHQARSRVEVEEE